MKINHSRENDIKTKLQIKVIELTKSFKSSAGLSMFVIRNEIEIFLNKKD